jgi:chromosome segregation ATPase
VGLSRIKMWRILSFRISTFFATPRLERKQTRQHQQSHHLLCHSSSDIPILTPIMPLDPQGSPTIMSELGGPSDFTENILFYMLPDAKIPNVTEPTTIGGEQKQDLEEYISSDDPFSSSPDARNSPSNLVVTAGPKLDSSAEDNLDDIHSEPSPSLRPTSRLHATADERMESPARQRRRRSASSSAIGDTLRRSRMRLPHSNAAQDRREIDQMDIVKSLERSLQLLREELESVKQKSGNDIQRLKHETESLQRIAAESKAVPIPTSSQKEGNLTSKSSSTNRRVSVLSQENDAMRLEMQRLKHEHVAELEAQKAVHDSKMADLQSQLSSFQISATTNTTRIRSLESQVKSLQNMLDTSEESAQQAREDLQEEQRSSESRIENLQDQLSLTEAKYLDAKDKIEELNGELSTLRGATSKQKSNDELQKITSLLQKERKEVKRLSTELENQTTSSSELADLHNEVMVSNDRAEDMQRDRDEARKKLDILARSLERHIKTEQSLRKELGTAKMHNSDLKIEMKSKSQDWSAEKQVLLHEMELRSRLLLIEWGKNEIGAAAPGKPQGYKYKYAQELE